MLCTVKQKKRVKAKFRAILHHPVTAGHNFARLRHHKFLRYANRVCDVCIFTVIYLNILLIFLLSHFQKKKNWRKKSTKVWILLKFILPTLFLLPSQKNGKILSSQQQTLFHFHQFNNSNAAK